MKLTVRDLAGAWREEQRDHALVLSLDGTARTTGKDHDHIGKWSLTGPNTFVARFVVPLNIPHVDDELNALALIYTVKDFTPDEMVLEEFDFEDLDDQVWKRVLSPNDGG